MLNWISENWGVACVFLLAAIVISYKVEPLVKKLLQGQAVTDEELEIMLIDLKNVLLSLMLQTEQIWGANQGFKAGILKKGEVIRLFLLQCSPFLKYFNLVFISDLIDQLCNKELKEIVEKLEV